MPTDAGAGQSPMIHQAASAAREDDVIFSRTAPIGPVESVGAMLVRNVARFGADPVCWISHDGEFRPVSWEELLRDVVAFGEFLLASGVTPASRVVLMSPNCLEALVVEFATMCLGATFVPIFGGYAPAQARELIAHADPTVLVGTGRRLLDRTAVPPAMRVLVTLEAISEAARDAAVGRTGATHITFRDALRRFAGGARTDPPASTFLHQATRVDPLAPCLMMYTSGTSGRMKGVVLTHDNILSQQRALTATWTITPEDRLLSYLPWHHSFGGIFEKYTALYRGAPIYLDDSFGKDFGRLLYHWMDVRPTIYFSAPRIYQQLVVHAQAHPEDEPRIFHPGLRFVFTAAAPLPANISSYFAKRRIPVVEGWGLTETSPCCTLTDLAEPRTTPGMVGYPIPGVRIRLAPDGEILVRGPNVMLGYRNDPPATAASLPGDGWFHTGDLGEFVGAGLRLVARKDRVFKLLNAEKIVPTEIENRIAGMNGFIRHIIVAGDGRDYLAALIFPDYFRIAEQFGDDRETADRVVKESFRDTIVQFNQEHPVRYERIEAFAVISRELSIENGELTPSMKVRVRDVLDRSDAYLEAIYQPTVDCDCRFLRRVMRITADHRRCMMGVDRTLDRCHECGSLVFGDMATGNEPIQGEPR